MCYRVSQEQQGRPWYSAGSRKHTLQWQWAGQENARHRGTVLQRCSEVLKAWDLGSSLQIQHQTRLTSNERSNQDAEETHPGYILSKGSSRRPTKTRAGLAGEALHSQSQAEQLEEKDRAQALLQTLLTLG